MHNIYIFVTIIYFYICNRFRLPLAYTFHQFVTTCCLLILYILCQVHIALPSSLPSASYPANHTPGARVRYCLTHMFIATAINLSLCYTFMHCSQLLKAFLACSRTFFCSYCLVYNNIKMSNLRSHTCNRFRLSTPYIFPSYS